MFLPKLEVQGEENPDWGYARTLRSVLMVNSAEWVQSVYSSHFQLHGKELIAPNRDYPYEGLLVYLEKENWKFLDCISVAVQLDYGHIYLPFSGVALNSVHIDPWEVTYHYRAMAGANKDQGIPFSVSYRLFSSCPQDIAAGCIRVTFYNPDQIGSRVLRLLIQPFVDIRHMYGSSDFSRYTTDIPTGVCRQIQVTNDEYTIVFYCPSATINPFSGPETILWHYKLGAGERAESNDGLGSATTFQGEQRTIASFFNLEFRITQQRPSETFYFACAAQAHLPMFSLADLRRLHAESLRHEAEQIASIERLLPNNDRSRFVSAVVARIIGVTKFKIRVRPSNGAKYLKVPYAGAWWFKNPWYRDIFEGILSNWRIFTALNDETDTVRDVLTLAYSQQDTDTGLIPNRMSEFQDITPSYNGVDSTLLFYMTGYLYAKQRPDMELARILLRAAIRTIDGLRSRSAEKAEEDGPPRIDSESGLILSAPHHSWIDTRAQFLDYAGCRFQKIPSRLSPTFVKDFYDLNGEGGLVQILSSPLFFLPEINAQWIVMLRGLLELLEVINVDPEPTTFTTQELSELRVGLIDLLERATANYLRIFWNPDQDFIYSVVLPEFHLADAMECEAAVTAAAILGEQIFTKDHLSQIWTHTSKTLLVHRYTDGCQLPFGILTTREDYRIFYGDHEYHGDVVWPRSTPYLLKLLSLLKQKPVIKQILLSNLDHQMTEGAAFYNSELLARPCGKNPRSNESTRRNPVPVKNPIQFWSQWCDPFIRFLEEEENDGSLVP